MSNVSGPSRKPRTSRPLAEAELLEREEQLALHGIASTARRMVEDFSTATDLPGKVRAHPVLATVLASCAGALLGGAALRLGRGVGLRLVAALLAKRMRGSADLHSPLAWLAALLSSAHDDATDSKHAL
jgi:hypothetical protein